MTASEEIKNQYGNTFLGQVTQAVVTTRQVAPVSKPAIVHTTSFEYSGVNFFYALSKISPSGSIEGRTTSGMVKKIVEPGAGAPIELHTVYSYDRFGNVITTTACASNFSQCLPGASTDPTFRTSQVSYDPADWVLPSGPGSLSYGKGRFPVRTINSEGHTEYFAYHYASGLLLQQTGPNGIRTCYGYDDFGRKIREVARCNTGNELVTTTSRFRSVSGDPDFSQVVTVTEPPTGGRTWAYADALSRPVGMVTEAFAGGFIEVLTRYDSLGRIRQVSKPFQSDQSIQWTTNDYHPLGHVEKVTQSLGWIGGTGGATSSVATATFEYDAQDGFTSVTTETVNTPSGPESRPRREKKNVLGKTAWIKDAYGVKVSYAYDSEGNLTEVRDVANNVTVIGYDGRGRKTSSNDPDMGTWSYEYYGFGDLKTQTDANGHTTSMAYDRLGRMIRRTDATGGVSEWVYDVATGAGVGKLAAMVSAPDPGLTDPCTIPYVKATGGNRAGRWYTYTAFGDVDEASECVDGKTFLTTFGYDAFGREDQLTYPEVEGNRFSVKRHYTRLGFLHYLSDPSDPSGGGAYWAATQMNAAGEVTQEYTRNGVSTTSVRNPATGWLLASTSTAQLDANKIIQNWSYRYDEAGNLRGRSQADQVNQATSEETFQYDLVDRVTSSRVQVPALGYDTTEGYSYDTAGLGNLTQKGSKGYTYGACQSGTRSAGPHAVCQVTGSSLFTYDGNGNMLSGLDRTFTYGPSSRVTHVESGAGNVDFIYGADGNRVVQVATAAGASLTARTVYVGMVATGKSLYEQTTTFDASTGARSVEHVQFLYAAGANAFALRAVRKDGAATPVEAMKYYHTDHLGSVTAMSDEMGRVTDAAWGGPNAGVMGYDPWGARRDPVGTAATPGSFNLQLGHREFTGHETIPNLGLVNMNGRIYDPALGRFLSPDPTIQFAANLQNYNRYSYVLNNPLRYTDPTGYALYGSGWVDTVVIFGVAVIGAVGCAATAGGGCAVAFAIFGAVLSSSAALSNGASYEQVGLSVAIGIVGGAAGGAIGGAVVGEAGQTLGGAMISGAIGGATSNVISTVVMGGQLSLQNILTSAATGAAMSALAWSAAPHNALSEASVAEGKGGGDTAKVLDRDDGEASAALGRVHKGLTARLGDGTVGTSGNPNDGDVTPHRDAPRQVGSEPGGRGVKGVSLQATGQVGVGASLSVSLVRDSSGELAFVVGAGARGGIDGNFSLGFGGLYSSDAANVAAMGGSSVEFGLDLGVTSVSYTNAGSSSSFQWSPPRVTIGTSGGMYFSVNQSWVFTLPDGISIP